MKSLAQIEYAMRYLSLCLHMLADDRNTRPAHPQVSQREVVQLAIHHYADIHDAVSELQRELASEREALILRYLPYAPKEEKDTHFLGFARLVLDRLRTIHREAPKRVITTDELEQQKIQAIAHAAYDFADYVLGHVKYTYVRDVSDMTHWPEEEEDHEE